MNDIIDMFTPYMYMFTFLITISISLFALFKGVSWIGILILNIIVSVIFNFMGLGSYDLLTIMIEYITDTLISIIGGLIDSIGNLFDFGWF